MLISIYRKTDCRSNNVVVTIAFSVSAPVQDAIQVGAYAGVFFLNRNSCDIKGSISSDGGPRIGPYQAELTVRKSFVSE